MLTIAELRQFNQRTVTMSAHKPPKPNLPPTEKEQAFARYIVAGKNQTEAAKLAGYSKATARQTGTRVIRKAHVIAEIGASALPALLPSRSHCRVRVRLTSSWRAAIEGAANNPRLVNAADLELRRTVDAEVAANLSGDYLDAALMENLEVALGRKKVMSIRMVGRGEKAKSIEVQMFDRDAGAANKAAELLYHRLEIRARMTPPGQRAPAALSPALREAIEKAGRIARGEE